MVAGALPPLRLLGQMLQSVVLPRLEKQVAPRFWSALRCARAATEEDPLLRLLLSTNRGPLDRLFAAYQLGGAQARAEAAAKEEIERFKGRIRFLKDQGTYSTIAVRFEQKPDQRLIDGTDLFLESRWIEFARPGQTVA